MAAKKKAVPRAKREYDLDNHVLRMTKGGKEYEFSFVGLRSDVFIKLAMIGAADILCKKPNPLVVWEKICQNRFGKERDYSRVPKVVKALSVVRDIKIEDAIKWWKEASPTERKEVKDHVEIRKELLRMQIADLDHPPS